MRVVDVTGIQEIEVCFLERKFRIRCGVCGRFLKGNIPIEWNETDQSFCWIPVECEYTSHEYGVEYEMVIGS